MFEAASQALLISLLTFFGMCGLLLSLYQVFTYKRTKLTDRLKDISLQPMADDEEILNKPFMDRTVGSMAKWLVLTIGQLTPQRAKDAVQEKLETAGNPRNLKAGDFLALQGILGITTLGLVWFVLGLVHLPVSSRLLFSLLLGLTAVYMPWFMLAVAATRRQAYIRRTLPDIMDLLVVSVEAGLAFDMALMKVVERFQGTVALEFQRALREMQLGKQRKDALKDMAKRVGLNELSSLVNAIVQSEQLGVGLGNVLRLQSDLIRQKRQQWIEEQAMKAPIKMLFPLVFFIFPCIFIVILGPAILNIMKVLNK